MYRSEVVLLEPLRLVVYLITDVVFISWNINTGIIITSMLNECIHVILSNLQGFQVSF